ncbi:YgjP-like metallopeptidase domain-containing protein [Candidatus Mycoplasma pogonae]
MENSSLKNFKIDWDNDLITFTWAEDGQNYRIKIVYTNYKNINKALQIRLKIDKRNLEIVAMFSHYFKNSDAVIDLLIKAEIPKILKVKKIYTKKMFDLESGWFYLFGIKKTFYIQQNKEQQYLIYLDKDIYLIPNIEKSTLEKAILDYIDGRFLELLKERQTQWAKKMGIEKALTIEINNLKTSWAFNRSCRLISYSSTLAFFKVDVIDSVIVHELAHCFEMNHSTRFKKILTLYYPDWKKANEKLKTREVD